MTEEDGMEQVIRTDTEGVTVMRYRKDFEICTGLNGRNCDGGLFALNAITPPCRTTRLFPYIKIWRIAWPR